MATGLIVGTLACAAPATPAVAAGPGRAFFGMQAWTVPNAEDVAMMKRGGVGTVRALFQGGNGSRDKRRWAPYDVLMTAAAKQRIEVLPVLLGVAKKARPDRRLRVKRPRTRAALTAWGAFVRSVAARYGRGGRFWEAHPELTPIPLTAYQVWNEPNLPAYWYPADDAAGYLRLVRLTRSRLLDVDPKAVIVLAGLPNSKLGTPMFDYVRAVYAQRGARALFDVVALHPYAKDAPVVVEALNRVRAQMNRRRDRRTPIWITEVGWATGGPRSPFTTSKAGQSARVARTFRALLAARRRLNLRRIMLFGLQDRAYHATETPWWGPRVGLFDTAGYPKPAWRTFVGFTGGQPGGRLPSVAGGSVPPGP
jgi:hypothetical protein